MSKDKKNDSGIDPKNTDKNGRDGLGKFTNGNDGRPRGATNKTTRDLRHFITNFLNEKTNEIPDLWDTLDNKDKLSLFMHLSRLVLPKPNEDEPTQTNQLKQPIWIVSDNSKKDLEKVSIKPIEWTKNKP